MKWVIYKHTNKINGKSYIGQTKQTLDRRWRNGIGYTKDNQDTHFARAIKKYGWDNFIHEVLEEDIMSIEIANQRETFWIKFYDSVNNGYNANYGGDSRLWSEESRIKASISHKGKHLSKIHLENLIKAVRLAAKDTKRNSKISQALKGRIFSLTHRSKISDSAKLRIGEKNPFYGHHHTKVQIDKYKSTFGKEVVCLETNVIYVSANEAGRILGVTGGSIRSSCRLGTQTQIGKKWFHFYYRNDEKPIFLYNKIRKVINIDTNELFENLIDAGKSIGKTSKLIGQCCNGVCKTAGGFHWMYFDEFEKSADEYIEKKRNENLIGKGRKKKIICVESGECYKSYKDAERKTGILYTCISKACNGKQQTAGGYHWEHAEEV